MKIPQTILFLLALITTIHAFALPEAFEAISESSRELFKRRGGGGGRSGGGFSSGGRTSGSSGSSSTRTLGTSNKGGLTSSGSGPQPRTYGGGSYYPGGAAAPYRAGSASPGGIRPTFFPAAGLAFFPGVWLYGAYSYHYPGYYMYHNQTSGQNETRPVDCLCGRFSECGCDANNETDYVSSVANNNTVARVANVDGDSTLVINGTLPNGTTAASAAPSFRQGLAELSGWWLVVAGVVYTIWFF